jgi:hypothetical protein
MSTATSDTKQPATALMVAPEERFWKRYSPRGEAPLSMAGSVSLHALAIAGGSDNRKGPGDAPEKGPGKLADEPPVFGDEPEGDVTAPRLTLPAPVENRLSKQLDAPSVEYIREHYRGGPVKKYTELEGIIRDKLRKGLGQGRGGNGPGVGPGDGPGNKSGKRKQPLTPREKRMLRWHMHFSASSGAEYLRQLRGLGAILAIPVNDTDPPDYRIVRDLRPPAKLLNEDLAKIQRIYWIDDKPASVRDLMQALGGEAANLRPSRCVAFMPEKLEAELFRMERSFIVNVLRLPFKEDRIDETHFRVVSTPGGYRPELLNVSMKR